MPLQLQLRQEGGSRGGRDCHCVNLLGWAVGTGEKPAVGTRKQRGPFRDTPGVFRCTGRNENSLHSCFLSAFVRVPSLEHL